MCQFCCFHQIQHFTQCISKRWIKCVWKPKIIATLTAFISYVFEKEKDAGGDRLCHNLWQIQRRKRHRALNGKQAADIRVVDVEQPVETHVDAERHVNQVFVLLLQAVVDGRQAVDDVGDRQQLTVVGELVLLEGVLGHAEVQQVHCTWDVAGGVGEEERTGQRADYCAEILIWVRILYRDVCAAMLAPYRLCIRSWDGTDLCCKWCPFHGAVSGYKSIICEFTPRRVV